MLCEDIHEGTVVLYETWCVFQESLRDVNQLHFLIEVRYDTFALKCAIPVLALIPMVLWIPGEL